MDTLSDAAGGLDLGKEIDLLAYTYCKQLSGKRLRVN
jgi:hypothetical protein